jgi:hypothetical protein
MKAALWIASLLAAIGGPSGRPDDRWRTLDLATLDIKGVHIDVPEDVEVAAQRSAFGRVVFFRLHAGTETHDFAVVDDGGFAPSESIQFEDARAVNMGTIVKEEHTEAGWLIVNEQQRSEHACRLVRSRRLNVQTSKNAGLYCASESCDPPEVAAMVERACRTIRTPEKK